MNRALLCLTPLALIVACHAGTPATAAAPTSRHTGTPASMLSAQDLRTYYDEKAETVFAPIRSVLEQRGIRAEFVSKVGHAGDIIAREAESGGFDLVMMGSHGHSALGKLVLGSVATRVMAQCQVPVLLVR